MDKRYQILDVIGHDSSATVFKAFDHKFAIAVAIKVIHFRDVSNGFPGEIEREINSLRLLNQLNHVNIVSLYKVDKRLSHCCLIFEYAEYNLHRYIMDRTKRINPKKILVQILRGIMYCHSCRVIHGDLKPSNILISKEVVKLSGFGESMTLLGPLEKCTSAVGTLAYRAPEVLLKLPYTFSIDMWSVGCIFVELVRQKPLFDASTVEFGTKGTSVMMDQIVSIFGLPKVTDLPVDITTKNGPIKDLAGLVPGLDDDGFDLLQKMLCLNPDSRITAADALLHPYFKKYGFTEKDLFDKPINDLHGLFMEF